MKHLHLKFDSGEDAQRLPDGAARRARRVAREAGRHAGGDQRAHRQDVVIVIQGKTVILNTTYHTFADLYNSFVKRDSQEFCQMDMC